MAEPCDPALEFPGQIHIVCRGRADFGEKRLETFSEFCVNRA